MTGSSNRLAKMKLIKYAVAILLGPLCGTNNMALVQVKQGFRKLTQFSIRKANSFQLSKVVNDISSIQTKNIGRLAENSRGNGFSRFMFSSLGNRQTTSGYDDNSGFLFTNVLKPVVRLFVLSLSFVVIYQKILVEFLVQSLVQ